MLHISNCDVGVTINGTQYEFNDVDDVIIDDPKRKNLIRGMNGKNKKGLKITEGLDQPYVITSNIKGVSVDLFNVMRQAYENDTRVDFWVIDRKDGSSYFFVDSLFNEDPIQKSISSDAESVNIAIVLHSFHLKDKLNA